MRYQTEAQIRANTKKIRTIRQSIAGGQRIRIVDDLTSVSDADLYAEYITRKINNTPLDLSDRPF